MIEKKIRPIWPIYAAGGVWILCGLIFPLYTLWAIVVTAILSLAVYGISMKLAPAKTILVPDPSPSFHTGEEAVSYTHLDVYKRQSLRRRHRAHGR